MQTEEWEKVKELLDEVLQIEPSERQNFLERSDFSKQVRDEVKSLLAFEDQADNLMNLSAIELSKDFFTDLIAEEDSNALVGTQIGVYQIIREIGHGGMGAVYLAERNDGKFEQKVALKLLKREMNTTALRRRFQQEQQILASLEHPNIARLLNAGTTDDKIPYLAMEYVEGIPIDDYCNKHQLDLGQRLDLFRQVCAAVNFAHRNLVVHRDLKPSNILINNEGIPKLLDFGISKILSGDYGQEEMATVTRMGAMTLGYASPEQLQSKSVTTSTDIYSLGVILYELLSGHRPFEEEENDFKEIYKVVLEKDPIPPSALIEAISKRIKSKTESETELKSDREGELEKKPTKLLADTGENKIRYTLPNTISLTSSSLRGDLDNIILKALRKEPERRYLSAENFAEDLHRHQRGLPVTARPNTFSYRAEKFIKRNRATVIAGVLILLAIIGGVIATLWQSRIAQIERTKAEKRFGDVRKLANSFLFEFSPQIENLPGSMPARQLLVTRALEYLDSLSQESATDLELQKELAKAYEKVGDVQGNPDNPNIGDLKGALESYEKAQAIRRQLMQNKSDAEMDADLANNLEVTANINMNGGEFNKAASSLAEAVELREKVTASGLQHFVSTEKRSFTDLAGLENRGPYDLVFSNFAGLNCTGQLDRVLDSLAPLVKPGGLVTLVLLPKFCLWEFLLLFRGKFRTAFRRFAGKKGASAHIEGEYFRCWYYNPRFVRRQLKADFRVVGLEGLCSFVPPSYIEQFAEKRPRWFGWLKSCEEKWKSSWPWRSIGDYYLITLQKNS